MKSKYNQSFILQNKKVSSFPVCKITFSCNSVTFSLGTLLKHLNNNIFEIFQKDERKPSLFCNSDETKIILL